MFKTRFQLIGRSSLYLWSRPAVGWQQ
jgi:hypothetical protein